MKSTIRAFLPCIALTLLSCTAPRPIDYGILDNVNRCAFSLGDLTRGDTRYADYSIWNCDSTHPDWTAPICTYELMVDSGNGFISPSTQLWIVAIHNGIDMSHSRRYLIAYKLCINDSCAYRLDARDMIRFYDDLDNSRSFVHRLANWIEDHYLEPGQSRSINAERAGFYLTRTFADNIAMIFGDPGYLNLPQEIIVR